LTLVARLTNGHNPIRQTVHWTVYKVEDATTRKWRKIAEKSAARPGFDLPEGQYVVRAAFGHASAATVVPVRPGKTARTTVIFNAGGLKVTSKLALLALPASVKPSLRLYKIGAHGGEQLIGAVTDGDIARLNAGPYRLVSRIGSVNAAKSVELIVKPGLLTEVEINHRAGIVLARFPADSRLKGPISWRLTDRAGKTLTRGRGGKIMRIVAPGAYRLAATRAGKIFTARFSIKTGARKTVRLKAAK
jgi:hypothetical protein